MLMQGRMLFVYQDKLDLKIWAFHDVMLELYMYESTAAAMKKTYRLHAHHTVPDGSTDDGTSSLSISTS